VRPLNDAEKGKGKAWKVDSNKIAQADPVTAALLSDAAPYTLDNIFDGPCCTAQVYLRTTRDLIHQVVEGFNSTVFAYGQTSSGKTHTMRGTDTEPGIIPLAVREIFDLISATKDREFLLRVSYMEVKTLFSLEQPTWSVTHCHFHFDINFNTNFLSSFLIKSVAVQRRHQRSLSPRKLQTPCPRI